MGVAFAEWWAFCSSSWTLLLVAGYFEEIQSNQVWGHMVTTTMYHEGYEERVYHQIYIHKMFILHSARKHISYESGLNPSFFLWPKKNW